MPAVVALVYCAVAALFWSSVAAVVLGLLVAVLTRGLEARPSLIGDAARLPFRVTRWMAVVFVAQALINNTWLDRDIGIDDEWRFPLPNGYVVSGLNDVPFGELTARGLNATAVWPVTKLQVDGASVIGTKQGREGEGSETDIYFRLDGASGVVSEYATADEFRRALPGSGADLHLETLDELYSRYRYTWLDWLMGGASIAVPLLWCVQFGAKVWRARSAVRPLEAG